MDPNDCIVPLFGLNQNGRSPKFLGTASFVGATDLLLTAGHVVRNWAGPKYGFAFHGDLQVDYEAELIASDEGRDLALLQVKEFNAKTKLTLADESQRINPNWIVVSYDYGLTYTAGNEMNISPATRLGNVTRVVDQTARYRLAGRNMLELSFPALKGASGAPVVLNNGFKVIGMIVANVAHHLLPVQIETIYDDSGQIEENTQFMLPQALAVNVSEIREFLASR